ncbi:chorismate-binding protein [Robbsia sp. Bb-Pol-6]|uniref:Chorismate-binding protein n=1 Tax=Robbsia betulipollinis TaxID=2981849 RepID=A0ABT3ZQR3_9BURK|nr:chorismate-binding protein [Robbsia betulipollinis]MCY0388827.1 chorismate-binding protein [Robbsia betulipollinis]
MTLPVFALLDDAQTGAAARSRLYTDFAHERRCTDPARLDAFWERIEADLRAGLFAVVLADYEWGVALHHLSTGGVSFPAPGAHGRDPALRVLLFRALRRLDADECDAWLAEAAPAAPAGILDVRHDTSAADFSRAIDRIHAALAAGDCYQVNYTFRLAFQVFGSPVTLYRQLRRRQPVAFGALLHAPAGWTLSLSPELFLRHEAGTLLARPMKGTAARGRLAGSGDPGDAGDLSHAALLRDADVQRGIDLSNDPKNRAENVMIVDLLRNDLGRIAPPGGVAVTALFTPEAWPTVWQLTSTIEARTPAATTFPDILRALFPCGSITGAPKRAAIAQIAALETAPRGLYTGAIGWIDAPLTRRCGDFCLSVAIRTIEVAPTCVDGLAAASAGVGAGIVLDSRASEEYAECLLKARFLTAADPGFALFETLLVVAGRVPHRARHVQRLCAAAWRLGFHREPVIEAVLPDGVPGGISHAEVDTRVGVDTVLRHAVEAALDATLAALADAAPHRVRLSVSKTGTVTCTAARLAPLAPGPVGMLLARTHGFADTRADDPLLRFKTTHRAMYDAAWQAAEREGAFDMLFVNAQGHLTEGARSNLFVKLDGHWFTPPVADGLLPGVMRGIVLDDPLWHARERSLTLADLDRAQALMLTNGLRGLMPAVIR